MKTHRKTMVTALCCVGLVFCTIGATKKRKKNTAVDLVLASKSFKHGEKIPVVYTCHGQNSSPELHWQFKGPGKVASYVLIVDDPDAKQVVGKTYVHWIALFPRAITESQAFIASDLLKGLGVVELVNSSGKTAYQGPCPPSGTGTHTYRFTLFATIQSVENLVTLVQAPCTAEECAEQLQGMIIAQAVLTGTYS